MTMTTNAENLPQYKIRFFLFAEKILAFASHPNLVRKVTMFYVIENFHLNIQIHFIAKL